MKATTIAVTLAWIALAAGLYALGRHHGSEPSSADGNALSPTLIGSSQNGSADVPAKAAGAASSLKPDSGNIVLVRESTGNEFIDSLLAADEKPSDEEIQRGIREAFDEKDPLKSNLMFAKLLSLLSPENAPAALEQLADLPRSYAIYNQYSLFRHAWGRIDGPGAAVNAMETDGRGRDYAIAAVMSGWVTEHPEAAIAWARGLEDEGDRSRFTRGLVRGLARTDVDRATSLTLEAHASGDGRVEEYVGTIAREQFNEGIDAAASWLERLPVDGGLRSAGLDDLAESYVNQDPAAAAAWVSEYAGTGYGERAIAEVADEWAERDPVAAVEWINTLPEGEERTRAWREAASEWTRRDPYAAAEYMSEMPAGADRDAAVTSLARRHVEKDPEAAIAWADSISDEELRMSTLSSTGRAWMRRNPDAAQAWLITSGLPAEVQQRITAPPEKK